MKKKFGQYKKAAVIVAFILSPFGLTAQEDSVQEAFTQSHYYERIKNFPSGVSSLKEVYVADSYAMNRLGWLLYNAEEHLESMKYYKIAIDLKPLGIEARLGYTYPASAMGNMTEVISQYKKVLEISPLNSATTYKLGSIYYDKKDFKSAIKYYEKVVTMYPFSYQGLLKYAWCHLKLGHKDEAKRLFSKVLLLSPGDKSATEGLSLTI